MRSIWKGPVIIDAGIRKRDNKLIVNRKTTIFPCFVGKKFLVKNGNNFLRHIYITEDMVGFKFGDFCLTKKS